MLRGPKLVNEALLGEQSRTTCSVDWPMFTVPGPICGRTDSRHHLDQLEPHRPLLAKKAAAFRRKSRLIAIVRLGFCAEPLGRNLRRSLPISMADPETVAVWA